MFTTHYSDLLRYYRRMIAVMFVVLVGGVIMLSTLFLHIMPVYTATAKVSLLPTQSELIYSQDFVRSSSINPANLMTQTHIENLISREISRQTIDRLIEQAGGDPAAALGGGEPKELSFKDRVAQGFRKFRNWLRRVYNTLNSGKHVVIDPYTDLVISLQESIEVEMIEGTYIMEVGVSWEKPEVAAAAANILADVYVQRAREEAQAAADKLEAELRAEMESSPGSIVELENQINTLRLSTAGGMNQLRVIDPAVVPIYPSFPKVVIYTFFAIAGWIVLTLFTVVAADTFSDTIKTRADMVRVFGARALGAISLKRVAKGRSVAADLAETARRLNLQGSAAAGKGAVVALGKDEESRAIASYIKSALTSAGAEGDLEITDLGGASEGYTGTVSTTLDWLVVGLRPGEAAQPELESIVEEWRGRGVGRVFGLLVKA